MTDGPAEFGSLIADLEERVFGDLLDVTLVYPGHGGDQAGHGGRGLPEWKARGF